MIRIAMISRISDNALPSPLIEQTNSEKTPLVSNVEKKDNNFSLLLALRNQQKTVLERSVASFIEKSEYENVRNTCTDMHGPITEDIDRRQRFKYAKKTFTAVMKPLCDFIHDLNAENEEFAADLDDQGDPCAYSCICSACIFCGPPSVIAASLAYSCTFFQYGAIDVKNNASNTARDIQIKNLLPGISMNIFENNKPKEPPSHQKMGEDKKLRMTR